MDEEKDAGATLFILPATVTQKSLVWDYLKCPPNERSGQMKYTGYCIKLTIKC